MKRSFAAYAFLLSMSAAALAASGRQPAPPGAFPDAPPQYTRFSTAELMRGFLALSFGSDLRIGARPRGIRRFDHPIRAAEAAPADIEVRLIDERNFTAALRAALGAKIARTFITRTNPQCMTSVKSSTEGSILRSVSFIIVDKGDDVFLDCAYHELLHAFGLSNHDQHNPWTTLNQQGMVGYMTVYDRALLTLLYDPHIRPGMTARQARARLPGLIRDLGLAAADERK